MLPSYYLEFFTHRFAKWTGTASGFVFAVISVIVWLIVGAAYNFSHDWQSALSFYIGIVTFLMVFLIQRGQKKELTVLHVKLNELISVTKLADNHLINVEELTEKEIEIIQEIHRKIGVNS